MTVDRILDWADRHRRLTGTWPSTRSGTVASAPDENWKAVHQALVSGYRGLPAGSSLARLLTERRRVRNVNRPPPLTEAQILKWVDSHFARTGTWPRVRSGTIIEAPGETWRGVDAALARGHRGLDPGSSLARLLTERRGKLCPRSRRRISRVAGH